MKIFNLVLGSALVFFVIMFLRCEKVTEVTELVKNTEKIDVVFYHDDKPNTVIQITDKAEIKKFGNYISTKDTPLYKCKYDGQIIFRISDDITSNDKNTITMEFNLQPDCVHVAYMYSEGLRTKELTPEGMSYLKALQ